MGECGSGGNRRQSAGLPNRNLRLAYQRVVENKGAAGVDGIIGIAEFKDHLKQHWPTIKAKLLAGKYISASLVADRRRREELGCVKWEDVDFQWKSLSIKDTVHEALLVAAPFRLF